MTLWWIFIRQVSTNTGSYQLPLSNCNTLHWRRFLAPGLVHQVLCDVMSNSSLITPVTLTLRQNGTQDKNGSISRWQLTCSSSDRNILLSRHSIDARVAAPLRGFTFILSHPSFIVGIQIPWGSEKQTSELWKHLNIGPLVVRYSDHFLWVASGGHLAYYNLHWTHNSIIL